MNRNNLMTPVSVAAQNLLSRGISLLPVENSPLQTLVGDVCLPTSHLTAPEAVINEIVALSDKYDPTIMDRSQYAVDSYKAAKVLADTVRANMNLIREQIQPMIKEIMGAATQVANETKQAAILTEIVMQDRPMLLGNNVFREMLAAYDGTPWVDVPQVNFYENYDLNQILGMAKHGSNTLHKAVDDIVGKIGAAALMDLVQYTFSFAATSMLDETKAVLGRVSPMEVDALLFLIGQRISADIVDRRGLTKEFQQMKMSEFQAGLAIRILETMRSAEQLEHLDVIVLRYPNAQKGAVNLCLPGGEPIVVDKEAYLAWLQSGGRPELIYGAMLSTRAVVGRELLEQSDRLLKVCEEHVEQVNSYNALNLENNVRLAVINAALHWIDQTPVPDCTQKSKEEIVREVRARLSETTSYDLANLANTIKNIVCDVIYDRTEAKTYIELLMAYEARHPAADPKQANVSCCLEILSMWAACCIKSAKV